MDPVVTIFAGIIELLLWSLLKYFLTVEVGNDDELRAK